VRHPRPRYAEGVRNATLPEWLSDEITRRAEADAAETDRLARRAAYDKWAKDYAAYMIEGRPDA
jgi:hypothetical protein